MLKAEYTQMDSKVGKLTRKRRNFCVWSKRPSLSSKAQVKTQKFAAKLTPAKISF